MAYDSGVQLVASVRLEEVEKRVIELWKDIPAAAGAGGDHHLRRLLHKLVQSA